MEQADTGLSGIVVKALAVADTALFAGTDGASVWRLSLHSGTTAIKPHVNKLNQPCAFDVRNGFVHYTLTNKTSVNIKLLSIDGRYIGTLVKSEQAAGSYSLPIKSASLAKGCYILSFEAGGNTNKTNLLNAIIYSLAKDRIRGRGWAPHVQR